MTAAAIVAMVAIGCAMISAIAGAATMSDIFTRVNERLPPAERFEYGRLKWWPPLRLFREYRRLYPAGVLLRRHLVAVALQFGFFAVCVAALLSLARRGS